MRSTPKALNAEPPKTQDRSVSPSYTWPGFVVSANSWHGYIINTDFEIVGAGIHLHEDNRVFVSDNYPSPEGWMLYLYNWEDHDVTYDVLAWS